MRVCVSVFFYFHSNSLQIRTENIDDDLPGHRAACVHGFAVDNCIVDVAAVRTVSTNFP